MRTASARFLRTITESHQAVVRIDVLDYRAVTDPVTQSAATVILDGVTAGTVNLDQNAATRARLDLTVEGATDLVPTGPDDLLAPYGNEIRAWRGVRYADGTEELISVGVFRIESATSTSTPNGLGIAVTGLDRSALLIEARFETPYSIPAGTNYIDALLEVLQLGYPSIQTDFPTTAHTTPLLVAEEGADRWAFAQDMATALGLRLYFDADGVCVAVPVANGLTPVASIAEGEGGVLVSAERGLDRAGSYNRVIAAGESSTGGAPVRGVASDDRLGSPTRYGGPYGRVPMFYKSPLLTTDDQALAAAESLLNKQLGSTQTVGFGSVTNPALEPDDTVRITRAALELDEAHVIDTLGIPLSVTEGAMAGTTRAVTVL